MKTARQSGFIPIYILIFLFLFIGVGFFFFRNRIPLTPTTQPAGTPGATTQPSTDQKLSLKDTCFAELAKLPKPPFSYERVYTSVSSLPDYKEERFSKIKETYTCVMGYSFTKVLEQAYQEMGLSYYEITKTGQKIWNYKALNEFPRLVDNIYSSQVEKLGFKKESLPGEENAFGPIYRYSKENDYKFWLDVEVAPTSGLYFRPTLTVGQR